MAERSAGLESTFYFVADFLFLACFVSHFGILGIAVVLVGLFKDFRAELDLVVCGCPKILKIAAMITQDRIPLC